MQQKSGTPLSRRVLRLLATFGTVTRNTLKLFALEYQLARRSLGALLVYSVLFMLGTLAGWIMISAFLILLLHRWTGDWLSALGIVLALHVFIVGWIMWRIHIHFKNMQFSYTRKHVFGRTHEGATKDENSAVATTNSFSRSDITVAESPGKGRL